ncbi:hypothetical protein RIF29_34684 [Crotalaria pallida]|uniref:Uncharacterized protein n=1 Tax=Crotalaria pallida TaxID=3830 RepID=A0AAN9E9F8_CROPI
MISNSEAFKIVNNGERFLESGEEREGEVDAAVLDLAVDRGKSTGDGRKGGADDYVDYEDSWDDDYDRFGETFPDNDEKMQVEMSHANITKGQLNKNQTLVII